MSEKTKSCNLTEDEINTLLNHCGHMLSWPNSDRNEIVDRINYLNKRLKTFNEADTVKVETPSPSEKVGW